MLHRKDRQLKAHHAADFARPEPTCVHHMLGVDTAALGDDVPTAIRSRPQLRHARAPHDFRSSDFGGFGIRVRNTVRIHVTFDGVVHGTGEMPLFHQGKEPRRLVDRDDFKVHAEIAAARLRHLQPVQPLLRAGEHDAPGDMHAAGLAGNPFYFLVELDCVLLQLGDIRITIDGVHASCGVPSGARRQFGSFDEQHVLPAGLCQVIKDAYSDDSAPDHHRLRMLNSDRYASAYPRVAAKSS